MGTGVTPRRIDTENGDGGIRTLDPLLARQVLSQLSYTPIIWHPPTLPYRYQHSTIGRLSLNHRVRDGNGCYPKTHRHQIDIRVSNPLRLPYKYVFRNFLVIYHLEI